MYKYTHTHLHTHTGIHKYAYMCTLVTSSSAEIVIF